MKKISKRSIAVITGIALTGALVLVPVGMCTADDMVIDDFESGKITNRLGEKTNVYVKAPSKVMMSFRTDNIEGDPTTVLMLRYDKRNEGGPFDMGGWCGYYTLLKKPNVYASKAVGIPVNEVERHLYLNASDYRAITLWVRGIAGKENFVVGLADAHWDKVGDSVKSEEIGRYLPEGKITSEWQKAIIPLDEFFVDKTKLSSVSINFEADCFPEGAAKGAVYIDDISLE